LYSYDGGRYVFEAEPYGGAISRGLARAEWIPLDHLAAVEGEYRLLMTNELEETEHVDEVKLLVVDHEPGVRVLPDAAGRLRSIRSPRPPAAAFDGRGRDWKPELEARDGVFWEPSPDEADPENLRHEILLEFPKPAGARTAKLIAEAWTTFRGSRSAKSFLASLGTETAPFFLEVDAHGPAYAKLLGWFAREEMYLLKADVETDAGWKTRAVLFGGGPFLAKEKAYGLDISDVPGDTLRIRVRPPAGFWRFDHFAVDYAEDAPFEVRELAVARAVDEKGRDAAAELETGDGVFWVMPAAGTQVELAFPAPPEQPGMERHIILKAAGWYDLHLKGEGTPDMETFRRMLSEPGYALRLAAEEWRRMRSADHANR